MNDQTKLYVSVTLLIYLHREGEDGDASDEAKATEAEESSDEASATEAEAEASEEAPAAEAD